MMVKNLTPATYNQALDMFQKCVRLGREALAAREEVSRILGFDMHSYEGDCIDEAALDAFYDEVTPDITAAFDEALGLAGLGKP